MQKILSTLTIAFVLCSGALAANASTDETSPPLPRVTAVLPDLTPPDLSTVRDLRAPEATPVKAHNRTENAPSETFVWTCGAPRNLASDATATVRECSYIAVRGGK